MTVIGIDPGVKTGLAKTEGNEIDWTDTVRIWELFDYMAHPYGPNPNVMYVIEDARKRSGGFASAQGAGWVKTLCGQIELFCKEHGLKYKMIAPIRNGTKLNAKMIKQITGYDQKTNEHERDAIMIAWSHK